MELFFLLPDQLQRPGKVIHVLFQQTVFSIHLVSQDKRMVSTAVELFRNRPAFRQVPHVHKSAARHQQDIRLIVRAGRF